MTLFLETIEETNMWFFRRKSSQQHTAQVDAQIKNVRQEMFEATDRVSESTDKVIKLLDDDKLGVTGRIFLATGGDKRLRPGKAK